MPFKKTINVFFRKAALSLAFAAAVGGVSVVHADQAVPQDTTRADIFVTTSNLDELAQKTPQIAQDFTLMDKLPLTGQDLNRLLTDPAHHFISCLTSGLDAMGAAGFYYNDTLRVQRGSGSDATFHECFHAAQAIHQGEAGIGRLTAKDALLALLLHEAAAIGYQMAAEREANNHGLQFRQTVNRAAPSDGRTAVFNQTYADTWQKNSTADSTTREAKALEAAGKAVVRYLLNGQDSGWTSFYIPLELKNVSHAIPPSNARNGRLRDDVYTQLGAVSSRINLTPEEYLGPHAGKNVDNYLKNTGFKIRS